MIAVAVCMFAAFSLTSCGDDDKDEPDNSSGGGISWSIEGTSWKVLSVYDEDDDEVVDDSAFIGMTMTFEKGGNCKLTPNDGWTYCKWTQSGQALSIVLGEGGPDDVLEGVISVSGDNATYSYRWRDYGNSWSTQTLYSMRLKRVK